LFRFNAHGFLLLNLLKLLILLSLCAAALALVPLYYEEDTTAVPERYIVIFNEGATEKEVSHYIKQYNLKPTHRYHHVFKGFAATIEEDVVDTMRLEEEKMVARIEREIVQYTQECIRQNSATWGISRVSHPGRAPAPGYYEYDSNSDGSGVRAYILDTGMRSTHNEWTGRYTFGFDGVNEGSNEDLQGHGTHVAGTVGGTAYGIAKKVELYAVKVCNQFGSCPSSATNGAYDYMYNQKQGSNVPMVVNMSYGGTGGSAACSAIKKASDEGVVFVAASGNSNTNSRTFFPASCPEVISVSATTSGDARSSFSNYGELVDVFAPGSSILSAGRTSDTATATLSGTSMASPHVCGVAARILSENPTWTVEQVRAEIVSTSSKGYLTNIGAGSENRLLFKQCD